MSDSPLRFTHGKTCPICGGSEDDPRSQGVRCHGFLRDQWAHCSREEHAGRAKFHAGSSTYAHKLRGKCPCGEEHAPAAPKAPAREIDRVYPYHDADGALRFEVVRFREANGGKTFRQRRIEEGGSRKWGLKNVAPLLYRLPAIAGADKEIPVWIVEGEKDVERLTSLGLLATCNPMGAGKWRDEYSALLKGRTCYIVADNDKPGRDHAQKVARSLLTKAAGIKVLELPGLAEHGDASDFLDGGGTLHQLLDLANHAPEWVPPPDEDEPAKEEKEKKEFVSHADILLKIAAGVELFRTPSGDGYCTIRANDRTEHHPVGSQAVQDWITLQFLGETDRAPSPDQLNQLLATLRAKARFSKTERPVGLRVAPDPAVTDPMAPVFYIDLANEAGQAVRVSAAGWSIVDDPPVKFRRPKGMLPLPMPQRGGSIDLLWPYCNVQEEDRILLAASLTHDLMPVSPQPIKVLSGEQGSCKSTTTEVFKRCVDPCRPMLGTPPAEVRDLVIIANNSWAIAFDNLSTIRPWFSDMLCRLSSGGGFQTRTLHTDDELTSFEVCRPITINGIDDLVSRLDLLSRAVILNCPTLEDDDRRAEDEFWAAFDADHPRIFGALLDAIVGGLAIMPRLEKLSLPRMAAYARWGEAVCRHLGWPEGAFLEAFLGNQQSASAELLEDSPLVAELLSMGRRRNVPFAGVAQELFEELTDQASVANRNNPKWPRGSRALSCMLRRLAPGLRRTGVNVIFAPRLKHSRLIHVQWDERAPPFPPLATMEILRHLRHPSPRGTTG